MIVFKRIVVVDTYAAAVVVVVARVPVEGVKMITMNKLVIIICV